MSSQIKHQNSPPKTLVFIDGDNQSVFVFNDLLQKLNTPTKKLKAFIFGNNRICLNKWIAKLELHEISSYVTQVPILKNSADLALIMDVTRYLETQSTIVIVSRDQLLIDFANLISEIYTNINIKIAYDQSITSTQIFRNLDVILLNSNTKDESRSNYIDYLIEDVYIQCIDSSGICSKSKFCDRLNQLGFKKSERNRILRHPRIIQSKVNHDSHILLRELQKSN